MSAGRGRGSGGKGKGKGPGKGAKGGGDRQGGRRLPPTGRSATPGRAPERRGRGRTGTVGSRPKSTSELGGEQVEGRNAVRELLVAGRRRVHEVVVSTDRADAPALDDILELARQLSVPVRELGRTKLASLARTDAHQGVIATAAPLRPDDLEDLLAEGGGPPPFLLAADGVTDPGNLGALLRTAECAGVSGVVLPRHRAVHVSPAVTKAAAGAVEHLRFAVVGGLPAALAHAAETGALVIGLDMDGEVSIHDLPPVDRPVVVVVGSEGRGLGRLVRQRCEVVASIPLRGSTESLNVSVAGALALYEIVRRRAG
jgi:23S rRNA (guanosine2251-2'-O)-methyltransferase